MVISKSRTSVFQNQGFEELSYDEILDMGNINGFKKIVNHAIPLIPRIIYNEYSPEIAYFYPKYDDLLYTICMEQIVKYNDETFKRRFFYSPSMTLIATLMRLNENQIRRILGEEDPIPKEEKDKIEEMIQIIKRNPSYIQKKRFSNILNKIYVSKIKYEGNAYNYEIKSKYNTNELYSGFFKQLITFENNKIDIPPFMQGSCSCKFHQVSNVKYEFHHITICCSHMELARLALQYPNYSHDTSITFKNQKIIIKNILNPFTPLDFPLLHSVKLRSILRSGLYNFLISQDFIKDNFDDRNDYHRRNGFTWFRCELDLFLLSFEEIYNEEFLKLFKTSINEELSFIKTAQKFGNYEYDEMIFVNADHVFNPKYNLLEHRINGKFKKVFHYAVQKSTKLRGFLTDEQFDHDKNGNHVIIDFSLDENDFEIYHVVIERKPIIDFDIPFSVSILNKNLLCYHSDYKMKKLNYNKRI